MHTMRFDLKFLDTLALLLPARCCACGCRGPTTAGRAAGLARRAVVLLLGRSRRGAWSWCRSALWAAKMDRDATGMHCLTLVPLFSIPPLAALILALREGAPRYPALTGALAGVAAAGVAATIYATNCTDDSPLFVATWYPLATLVGGRRGALAGRRWLTLVRAYFTSGFRIASKSSIRSSPP